MNTKLPHTDGDLAIVNVVATGELAGQVNLEHLYDAADKSYAQYDPIHHQGCYFRFEGDDGPLITVYNSGKYIIRAESIEKVHEQKDRLLDYLQEIGVPDTVENISFDFNNIVCTTDLGIEIDLEALWEDLEYADPTNEPHTGRITYRHPDTNCTVAVFRRGTVVILGAPSFEDAEKAYRKFSEELKELFLKEQ